MAHAADDREAHFETSMRRSGWITVDEAGWDGNLICHSNYADDRAGPEFGSWEDCWKAVHQPTHIAHKFAAELGLAALQNPSRRA